MVLVSGWAGHFVHRKTPEGICFTVNSEQLPAHYLLLPPQGLPSTNIRWTMRTLTGSMDLPSFASPPPPIFLAVLPREAVVPSENILFPHMVNQSLPHQMVDSSPAPRQPLGNAKSREPSGHILAVKFHPSCQELNFVHGALQRQRRGK